MDADVQRDEIMRNAIAATIPEAVSVAAEAFGNSPALVDGALRLSFAELHAETDCAAAGFVAAGLQPGDRVALWAPNSAAWIVACLGAQAAGGVVVPMNTRLKGREAQFILNRSRARILVMARPFLNMDYERELEGLDLPHLANRIVLGSADWAALSEMASPADRSEAALRRAGVLAGDASDILFTSGTTGQPKGVVCGHGQSIAVFRTWADRVGLAAGDRYLIVNPFFHTFGYKAGWLACILAGATIYPQASLDVARVIERIDSERITVLPGPPTLFHALLARPPGGAANLSSLRLAVTGAATVAPSLIERMRKELGIARVLTGYGLTESCGVVTLSDAADSAARVATSCGRAIPGVEVRCVDAEMREMPTGQAGEVVVRGYNVMQGYFEDPAATQAAIDADGWLHTGDVGRLDADGYLQITDRLKDMYISGGFNCYPAEIERIIAEHPGVAQVAVIGVPDERLGEVGCACIVPRPGISVVSDELLAWCRTCMANYKVPREIVICANLPTNASGKILKGELRQTHGARHASQ